MAAGRGRGRRGAAPLPAALGALGRSLPGPRVAPEAFRRAKFDGPQASAALWSLLRALVGRLPGGERAAPGSAGAPVRLVKSVAWSHGYRRWNFYQLPSDGSGGSRELLLAFSWLLGRIGLMEQLLAPSGPKPWDEAAVCVCDSPLRSPHRGRTPAPRERLQGQRDVRHLQWLYGRLRFQWRSRLAEQQEQCKLLHKIHSCTIGSHTNPMIGHFSATEVDVMRQPENYKQLLQAAESESARLEAFLEWKPLELVFWQWMETVLDSEAGDAQPHTVGNQGSPLLSADLGCCGISEILEELAECRKELVALRGELRERTTCRKRSCSGKDQAREQDQLGGGELRLAVEEAQEAAKLQLSGLGGRQGACSIRAPHGPYRLVFESKRPTASKMGSRRSAAPGTAVAGGMAATDVIRELRKQEAALRTVLEQQQEEARRKMHRAAEGLSHVLLIPPSKRPSAR